jgi:hypothetical protein
LNRYPVALIAALFAVLACLRFQQASAGAPRLQAPVARDQDVKTVDGIVQALYEVISGPAGQKRDWDRFRSLFAPGARLIPALSRPGERPVVRVFDVEDYIRRTDAIFETEDFWERENGRKVDASGNLVHVFSMYESRRARTGQPFQTGVNSIQLFDDGTRWWIVTVMWNSTR